MKRLRLEQILKLQLIYSVTRNHLVNEIIFFPKEDSEDWLFWFRVAIPLTFVSAAVKYLNWHDMLICFFPVAAAVNNCPYSLFVISSAFYFKAMFLKDKYLELTCREHNFVAIKRQFSVKMRIMESAYNVRTSSRSFFKFRWETLS